MDRYIPGLIAPSTRTPGPRFVTDVVIGLGLASIDDVHAAVEAAKTSGERADAVLLRTGVLDEDRLSYALAERYGLDRLDLDHFAVDADAARLVNVETALRHEALPVARLDARTLLVAVADPAGGPGSSAVAAATGLEVVPAVAPRGRLRALIEATASRVTMTPPPEPEPSPAPAPIPDAPQDAAPSDRVAELEHQLGETHGHLAAAEDRRREAEHRAGEAEERAAAARHRVHKLESELQCAEAVVDAVRDALRIAT
jgi:hypothetical protein